MNLDKNFITGFYKDLDENFKQACLLCENAYNHSELVEMLINGNIPQKQFAAINFDYVNNDKDALVLLKNLTGCDGKIREAVALKINQLVQLDENARRIFSNISSEILADASIDINANICRLAIDSACLLKTDKSFSLKYSEKLVSFIKAAFAEIDKFEFRDKKYVINKQIFKLYWCLEALNYFYEYIDTGVLKKILQKSIKQKEYTVREKAAQIVVTSSMFPEFMKVLKEDENYYVRQIFAKWQLKSS